MERIIQKDNFSQKQTIELRVFENNLYFLDLSLNDDKIPGVKGFVEKMQKRAIRKIIFNNETNITDINAMITLLGTAPESISFLGGIHAILKQNGAQNIKVIEYYYKRRTSVNHEWPLSLNDNPIFQFFIDDSKTSLPPEQAHLLYELLKETPLVCKLIKAASQYQIHNQISKSPENEIILKIVKKIKTAITELNISEETEMRTILHDILTTFSDEDLFDLVFEHSDDDLINYTNVSASVPDKLGLERTAEFITQKITASNENTAIINRTKKILGKLFSGSGEVTKFLPIFEDMLLKNILSASKAKRVINDICSSIDPEFYLKIDTELSLGAITETEKADILAGLKMLKSVPLKKEIIKIRISSFDPAPGYFSILEKLVEVEQETEMFIKMLDKITGHTNMLLEQNSMEDAWKILDFFYNLISDPKRISPAHKTIIIESLATLAVPVLEGLITKTFSLSDEKTIEAAIKKLLYLFPSNLMMLLIKRFISSLDLHNEALFRRVIANNYLQGSIKYNDELSKMPVFQTMRLLDLLQDIKNDDMLPFLWKISFLENIIIAQKSIKLIALKKSDKSLPFLIKAINRSEIHLRIAGLESLGFYDTNETRAILAEISRGKKNMTDSPLTNIDLRITALRSLEILDRVQAVNIFCEILRKKRLFFISLEPKKLRLFAAERLKQLS